MLHKVVLQYIMTQGIVSELFGSHTARYVSYVRLRGWFEPLHVSVVYSYFIHISVTAVVLYTQ